MLVYQPESQNCSLYNPQSEFDIDGNIEIKINAYTTAIESQPDRHELYWELGLIYLRSGDLSAAQATWFAPFINAEPDSIDRLADRLFETLTAAVRDSANREEWETVWQLCTCIEEIKSGDFENICQAIIATYYINYFDEELLEKFDLEEIFKPICWSNIDPLLVRQLCEAIIALNSSKYWSLLPSILKDFAEKDTLIFVLEKRSLQLSDFLYKSPEKSVILCQIALEIFPDCLSMIRCLVSAYCKSGRNKDAIDTAKKYYQKADTLVLKFISSYYLIKTITQSGSWQEALPFVNRHYLWAERVIAANPQDLPIGINVGLALSSFFFPYVIDDPEYNRYLHNQLGKIFSQNSLDAGSLLEVHPNPLPKPTNTIRIGYVGYTFRRHSVGWLCRWLISHHDLQNFQVFIYALSQESEEPFYQEFFRDTVHVSRCFTSTTPETVATQIRNDEIDILIDLDSLSSDFTYHLMSLRCAPIQATWLGWDASGNTQVDYFIADNYVVPAEADEYYSEKIWRLPQTYLAVDGFEVGMPTISRQSLNIPEDAVIYYSVQHSMKRHPDMVRLQFQILKEVPNSYFLIKGISNKQMLSDYFSNLAAEVGISMDRFRFLDADPSEVTHRANLAIADVVLDTFPYNGATTTLETLWMAVPLVTKVGKQFSARNSYTFMVNAGIEEGIAWNDEEYVAWGVKLGTDPALRAHIAAKLRSGRHTAPLWDGKAFTRQMEDAYRQMRTIYLENSLSTEIGKKLWEIYRNIDSENLSVEIENLLVNIDRDPDNDNLYWQLISAYLKLGKIQQSREAFSIYLNLKTFQKPDTNDRCIAAFKKIIDDRMWSNKNNILTRNAIELARESFPAEPAFLGRSIELYLQQFDYDRALEVVNEYNSLTTSTIDQIGSSYYELKTFFEAGMWRSIPEAMKSNISALEEILKEQPRNLTYQRRHNLTSSLFFLPYISDDPKYTKHLCKQIGDLYAANLPDYNYPPTNLKILSNSLKNKDGKIRIGYIGHTLHNHSVGWLSRWLIEHHDRDDFQIFTYGIDVNPNNKFYIEFFRDRSNTSRCFANADIEEIRSQILADEIDILIDLDSLTSDNSYHLMSLRCAPIQATWLGWDASGNPEVDYFIADNYVLPTEADEYYCEKIWRLPQSYVAVDRFEVGTPTISRQSLNIPENATIYYSSQIGMKRHPDMVRLQLEILKAVPDSYFLIKGPADRGILETYLSELAAEVGVSIDRLRFLDRDRDEITHRANLAIADVVLDTFPYNGATTTLETLWMGVPLVTKVGKQFSARNSYTFMVNAGIEEGIAWNDEEYVAWGVKLGSDPALRAHIAAKLRSGRHTAPLWDGKAFTRQMEDAYRQMWELHLATELN
jgi:predicted O-linked N-acetylglucosamine transferase (SPINDLY family)